MIDGYARLRPTTRRDVDFSWAEPGDLRPLSQAPFAEVAQRMGIMRSMCALKMTVFIDDASLVVQIKLRVKVDDDSDVS